MKPSEKVLFDKDALTELYKLESEDDPHLVKDLLKNFARESIKLVANLKLAIRAGDAKDAELLAHSLKSMSQLVGALRFADLAAEFEEFARNSNIKAMELRCELIQQLLSDTLNTIPW